MDRRSAPHAVVLFDGVCNLCNGFVQFVIPRDPDAYFRFAALDSEAAGRVLSTARDARHGGPLVDSIMLVEEGVVYVRSAAALRIYDLVARRRYRWFGRRETCMVPGPGVRDRFLD